ncbi:sensor histidine kinase [Paenibacillus sp. CF384]|uniref:sensor histidine kinase n=1 Tax=Paenibacillus sp. CF384 TaxID=1884382 RepID=UPI000895F0FA|nr:sensor histidine kinase [Paenibacillus sp. CF384]SDW03821.1 two-component system, sensor histidine kinase YesM [Paenibacillus sp. CF384]
MKRLIPRSLQFRISWIYMLISVFTIGTIGTVLYVGISRAVMNESIQSADSAISKSGNLVEMYIDRLKVLTTMLAQNPQTIQTLSSPTKEGEQVELQLIHLALLSDPNIKSVVVIGKDGYVLSNETKLNMIRSSNMMNEPWYVAAINSTNPVLTSARMQKFSMDKNNWVISMSQEIRDANGRNLGVVLLDIEYKGIENYMNDLDLGRTGFAFIINSSGGIVYHNDPSYFTDADKQDQLRMISMSKQGYQASDNRWVNQTKLRNSDWTLVGVSSLDGLQQVRNQLLRSFFLVGLGLLLLIILVSPFLAKSITRPIRRLEQAMQKVKSGTLEVSVSETGATEVQGLAQHFNSMVTEMRRLMQDIETKEKTLHKYELSVLHSQINPHFLYNTLDTIVWMAEFNESERVISTTKALAKFFQLSLSGGSEFTTVENEMNHVAQYLFIQKERYGDKLNYHLHFDPDLSAKVIPKIILQPLVENAIYHGIREKEGPGLLLVTCLPSDDGNVQFVVQDDGVGFDPGVRAKAIKEESTLSLPKLGGVGINNVDERLKLYYGEQYGITLQSRPGEGTTVRIVIP